MTLGTAHDEAARHMTHTEYLAADFEPDGMVRVAQISAPVFQADGHVGASIMLLGPIHEVSADEITQIGDRVAAAAAAATAGSTTRWPDDASDRTLTAAG